MSLTLSGNPNILSKISFCDKECSNINDNKTKAHIVDLLDKNHKIQIMSKDYMYLNPNTMRNVSFHQHILSTYTNGNPYLLYLAKIDGVNSAIYIDKKLKSGYTYPKMHCVKYRFDDSLFEQETIFSGELIRDSERRWYFLIDNILLYKGMNTNDKNILGRFELIHNILKNEYTQDSYLEICPIQVKKLFLYKNIRELCEEFIPTLSYTCKGIIFYTMNNRHSNYAYVIPRETQIPIKNSQEIDQIIEERFNLSADRLQVNTQSVSETSSNNINNCDITKFTMAVTPIARALEPVISQLPKLAPNVTDMSDVTNVTDVTDVTDVTTAHISTITSVTKQVQIGENNIVFRILKTDMPDIYNLYYCTSDNQLIKHSIALIPNIKISLFLYETFKAQPNTLTLNIECRYSTIFAKWCPVRFVSNPSFTQLEIDNIEKIVKIC